MLMLGNYFIGKYVHGGNRYTYTEKINFLLFLQKMKKACEALIGTHDFRNLCKMDVNNGVTNFTRKVISADIHKSCTENTEKGCTLLPNN